MRSSDLQLVEKRRHVLSHSCAILIGLMWLVTQAMSPHVESDYAVVSRKIVYNA